MAHDSVMLRIDRPTEVDDAIAFADDEHDGRYYVVATEPRLALRPDGTAALDLIKWRDGSGGSGGILTATVDLAPPPAAIEALRATLGPQAALGPPQWTDGTATLLVPGLAGAAIQRVPMSLFGYGAAQFNYAVDAPTATVVEAALRDGKMLLQADFLPHALGRLSSGRMRIVVHSGPVGAAWPTAGDLTGQDRLTALASAGAVEVQILDPPQGGSAVADQLTKWGWSLVDSMLPRGAQPAPAVSDRDILIEGRTVLACPLTATGTVLGFDPVRDHDFVTELDLGDPLFKILDVALRVNALFVADDIAAVTVHLSYGGQTTTFDFTEPGQQMHARYHWDDALGGAYSYRTVVHFKATTQPLELPARQSDSRELTVNLDDVGRLTVDVSTLDVDWTDVAQAVVTIESGGGPIPPTSEPVRLTTDVRGARYERRAPGSFDGAWRYSVDYVFSDGRRIHHDPAPGFGHQIAVPDPYPDRLRIDLAVADGFDGIDSHTVELRYGGRLRTVVLDAAHPSATVSFGTDDPTDRTYRRRVTTRFANGTVAAAAEVVADSRLLAIHRPRAESLDLRIAADLLDPAIVKLVRISVTHPGPGGADVTDARALSPGGPDAVISIPLNGAEKPWYTVSTTVYRVDGTRAEAGPRTSSDAAIVLPPQGI